MNSIEREAMAHILFILGKVLAEVDFDNCTDKWKLDIERCFALSKQIKFQIQED